MKVYHQHEIGYITTLLAGTTRTRKAQENYQKHLAVDHEWNQLHGSLQCLSSDPLRNVDISSVRGQCCHLMILKNSTIKKKNKTFLTLVLQWEGYLSVPVSRVILRFLRLTLKLTLPVRGVSLDTFILLIVSECWKSVVFLLACALFKINK